MSHKTDPAVEGLDAEHIAVLDVHAASGQVVISVTEKGDRLGVVFSSRESIQHVISLLETAELEAFGPPLQ